jgi:hypothetical protein
VHFAVFWWQLTLKFDDFVVSECSKVFWDDQSSSMSFISSVLETVSPCY